LAELSQAVTKDECNAADGRFSTASQIKEIRGEVKTWDF
jgi:hypothetical protein